MRHPGLGGFVVGLLACLTSAGLAMGAMQASSDYAGVRQSMAFACGYIYGQRAMIRASGSQVRPPAPTESCPEIRDAAIANGFTTAKDDQ